VFDHLVPLELQLEGQYQYYCTDFTYDGFGFKNGRWYFGTFMNLKNESNKNDKLYNFPSSPARIRSNQVIEPKEKKK
jgi:hypothetical protein